MSKRTQTAMWSVLAMLTIWCTWNSTRINNTISEQNEVKKIVNSLADEYTKQDEITYIKETSFEDAFTEARNKYGSGYIFMWNGDYYTTDYYEESQTPITSNINGWVLNGDDIDDYCKSNVHDECGICDGSGARTWYADRDSDGLGDRTTSNTSCDEPVALIK